jgi:hypothetical protein
MGASLLRVRHPGKSQTDFALFHRRSPSCPTRPQPAGVDARVRGRAERRVRRLMLGQTAELGSLLEAGCSSAGANPRTRGKRPSVCKGAPQLGRCAQYATRVAQVSAWALSAPVAVDARTTEMHPCRQVYEKGAATSCRTTDGRAAIPAVSERRDRHARNLIDGQHFSALLPGGVTTRGVDASAAGRAARQAPAGALSAS